MTRRPLEEAVSKKKLIVIHFFPQSVSMLPNISPSPSREHSTVPSACALSFPGAHGLSLEGSPSSLVARQLLLLPTTHQEVDELVT